MVLCRDAAALAAAAAAAAARLTTRARYRCPQIIVKPTGSKIAMLKAEVDILTKCDHPNV